MAGVHFLLLSVLVYMAVGGIAVKIPRPLVIWHGLGDSYSSPGLLSFCAAVKEIHPGIFIHSVYIEKDMDKDKKASFYGNVNEQIELVAAQIAAIPELVDGFDGIGFSQGGQFLRSYIEQFNAPPVHNLITFGSQHMGIADIPLCRPYDFLCQVARRAAKSAVYGDWAQAHLVQAQYFRDPFNMDAYISSNQFLAPLNNEIPEYRNESYAKNLASIHKLVLVIFTNDTTVIPKESAWFGSEAIDETTESLVVALEQKNTNWYRSSEKNIIPMRRQPLYTEDWIGLRDLDERGSVVFESCEGEHMQLGDCWQDIVKQYVGDV